MTKFEIYEDKAGEYRWRLVAGNGEVVAVSQAYTTKQSALEAAAKIPTWVAEATVVDQTL